MSTQPTLDRTAEDERAVGRGRVRVTAEAGITAPRRLFTADVRASIAIDHFGASADYRKLSQEFGTTAERVAAAARDNLARARA